MKVSYAVILLVMLVNGSCKAEPITIILGGAAAGLTVANYAVKGVKSVWGWFGRNQPKDNPTKKALDVATEEKTNLQKDVASLKLELASLYRKINERESKEKMLDAEKKTLEVKYQEALVSIRIAEQALYLCYMKCLSKFGPEQCAFIEELLGKKK